MLTRVLIANRGEIAIRIARAARACDIEAVGIHADVDESALHTQFVSKSLPLELNGDTRSAVSAYLDSERLVSLAAEHGCDGIHPGYGFLSENARFASMCDDEGIEFVGPTVACLEIFGDKVRARELAESLDIPVVPGVALAEATAEAARETARELGYPIMIKAVAGGGGRGMQVVVQEDELAAALDRCGREAEAAFGNGALFLEKYIERPRHIEVQIMGDGTGEVVHLYERDCSIQQRHQKIVEIAPAPNLDGELRERILENAMSLGKSVSYRNAGTVEFLVDSNSKQHYFIECNPRIQVEHTVTEEVLGIDLVAAQFRIAGGASLADVGWAIQSDVPKPKGFSIQARVVAAGSGTINGYKEPFGPGVRVDSCAYSGCQVSGQFDPLISKVITTNRFPGTFEAAANEAYRNIGEYQISGIPTNLGKLRSIFAKDDFKSGDLDTNFIESIEESDRSSDLIGFLDQRGGNGNAMGVESSSERAGAEKIPIRRPDESEIEVTCPIESTVVDTFIERGKYVQAGQTLITVSAMKMETNVIAPCAGKVIEMLDLQIGDTVPADQVVTILQNAEQSSASKDSSVESQEQSWIPLLDQVQTLKDLAAKRLRPDSEDPGVVRQRSRGKLTCRERIELLLDDGSFHEIGSVTGFATYDEDGNIADFTPANHVGGWGTIESRTTIVCADDFTSRGGHSDGAIGAKSSHLDRLSIEMRVPSIRLLDGSSGGGSVASMVPQQKKEGESSAKESKGAIKAGRPRVAGGGGSFLPGHLGSGMYAHQLSTVPVVNMLLGSVVGIGAAKAVLGHFSVMVRDIAQLFVAGPPVVQHAMGYDITKEHLGDWRIHCRNGSVDNLAESEEDAVEQVRRFLSYLPSSVYDVAPRGLVESKDLPFRREEELLHIVPRKRTTTFDIRRVIELIADRGSFFELGGLWGTDQVTGFVRINGYVVGVLASDSRHANGGALTADGCRKLTRHQDLCDLFHIPILNLVDNPGFAVGLEHEIAGTIRAGGEWMVAFSQVKVPVFTVVMRRSFGVAGNNYATPRSAPSMRVAWPAADVGGIPPEGGIEAAYKRQLAEAEDPAALRAELNARIESARGPLGPLSRFQIEEMIDPRDTRQFVSEWVEMAYRIVNQADQLGPRELQFRP